MSHDLVAGAGAIAVVVGAVAGDVVVDDIADAAAGTDVVAVTNWDDKRKNGVRNLKGRRRRRLADDRDVVACTAAGQEVGVAGDTHVVPERQSVNGAGSWVVAVGAGSSADRDRDRPPASVVDRHSRIGHCHGLPDRGGGGGSIGMDAID